MLSGWPRGLGLLNLYHSWMSWIYENMPANRELKAEIGNTTVMLFDYVAISELP